MQMHMQKTIICFEEIVKYDKKKCETTLRLSHGDDHWEWIPTAHLAKRGELFEIL